MNLISFEGKANFFEMRNADYQKAGVMGTKEDKKFSLETDF